MVVGEQSARKGMWKGAFNLKEVEKELVDEVTQVDEIEGRTKMECREVKSGKECQKEAIL